LPGEKTDESLLRWARNRACDIALRRWARRSFATGTYLNPTPSDDVVIVSADTFVVNVLFRYLLLGPEDTVDCDLDEWQNLPYGAIEMHRLAKQISPDFSPRPTDNDTLWREVDSQWKLLTYCARCFVR
jgi:hypothetical protein